MDILSNLKTYSASEARENLYALIKSAAKGTRAYEIKLRGSDPVIVLSKAELDSWQETLDILSSPDEVAAIRRARKQTKTISHEQLLKKLGLVDEA